MNRTKPNSQLANQQATTVRIRSTDDGQRGVFKAARHSTTDERTITTTIIRKGE